MGTGAGGVTLLVASDADNASVTMADALLAHSRFSWTPQGAGRWVAEGLPESAPISAVHLWRRPDALTTMDGLEEAWAEEVGPASTVAQLRDVIFLSKHAAASGQPSLTAHPIGNPRPDLEPFGGLAGRFPPPSPRLASLFRSLTRAHGRPEFAGLADFDVTFEATHHGPFLRTPALFAEIGSTSSEWCREDAGHCWAEALWSELAGDATKPAEHGHSPGAEKSAPVLVIIGGNHYMAQANDLALKHEGLVIGHMLPSYTFVDAAPEDAAKAVRGALEATAAAHPTAEQLLVMLYKKKLRSAERTVVLKVLADLAAGWDGPPLRVVTSIKELGTILSSG